MNLWPWLWPLFWNSFFILCWLERHCVTQTCLFSSRYPHKACLSLLRANKKFFDNNSKDIKEEIWLSPMTEAPTPTEMSKGQSDNTNNATKKFDYTTIADRLWTVSWSNYSHPTGVVNRFMGPPSHSLIKLKTSWGNTLHTCRTGYLCHKGSELITRIFTVLTGEAIVPVDVGVIDNYRVKKQLLHSW